MMPGPDEVMRCRSCGTTMRKGSLLSGNTCGAELWSDGFLAAPMLPDFPPVGVCPGCKAVFRTDLTPVIAQIEPWESSDSGSDLPGIENPSSTQLHRMARRAGSREMRMCIGLWALWEADHPWRKRKALAWIREDSVMALLGDLQRWADPTAHHDHLLLAEIARQQGDFEAAQGWLNSDFQGGWPEELESLRSQLEAKARARKQALFPFE